MPGIPGLNGGYYGALPAVQPAHSSAPVNLLGPGGPINSLVGAPGNGIVNESSFNSIAKCVLSFTTGLGNDQRDRDRDREREKVPSVAHDASTHRLDTGSSAANNSGSGVPPQHPDRIKSPPS